MANPSFAALPRPSDDRTWSVPRADARAAGPRPRGWEAREGVGTELPAENELYGGGAVQSPGGAHTQATAAEYSSNPMRVKHQEALDSIISGWTSQRSSHDVLRVMGLRAVPHAP